ncbi:hypothetical protein REPUB_Repub15cG0102600 [Reevesia pubescens]
MAEVKLHGFWASPFSYRVIWALKLKGIDYEYIEEDLGNKSELLLKYNPVHKEIPVLVHGDKAIAESLVILEYIEETWPQPPLLPHDPYEKAIARFWVKVVGCHLLEHPAHFSYFGATGEEQEKGAKDLLHQLKVIEEGLGNKKFFGGDTINLVDISCGWLAHWFPISQELVGVKLLEPTTLPQFTEWTKNFRDVPVIRENLPDPAKLVCHIQRVREKFLATSKE